MDRRWFRKLRWSLGILVVCSLFISINTFAGEWKQGEGENKDKWWYDEGNGCYPVYCWRWIDGDGDGLAEYYYFDKNGWVPTKKTMVGNIEVDENGAWVKDGEVQRRKLEDTSDTIFSLRPEVREILDMNYGELVESQGEMVSYNELEDTNEAMIVYHLLPFYVWVDRGEDRTLTDDDAIVELTGSLHGFYYGVEDKVYSASELRELLVANGISVDERYQDELRVVFQIDGLKWCEYYKYSNRKSYKARIIDMDYSRGYDSIF